MNIEQLYFTRTDGDSSGWRFVNISDGVTEDIKQGFQGIHTHTPSTKDMYSFDYYNKKYYLSKVTADGVDALGRAKCFIHGYVFSGIDSEYIFNNTSRLLCLDSFATNEDSDIVKVDDLPNASYDSSGVARKLNLENLMNGVYEAILSDKPLYIYTDIDANELLIKSIMCVIYELLPLNLRNYVSFSSAEGGLVRKITIINSFNESVGIVYDFNTGDIKGCEGNYKDFVKAMLSDPQTHLDAVEKYIEDAHETTKLNVDAYNKAFNFILMRNSNADSISDDEVVVKLTDLLLAEKFNDQANASYIAMLIMKIVNAKINVSSAINSMIVGVYMKTNNKELKESISEYIAYSYETKCTDNDFLKFQELKLSDAALYKKVTIAAISNNSSEFIRHFSIAAISNVSDCLFISEECGYECASKVGADIAKYINDAENGSDLIKQIIGKTLHKYVVDTLVTLNPDKEVIWTYLENVFVLGEYYSDLKHLESSSVHYLFDFIVSECLAQEDRAIALLQKIYTVAKDSYEYLEVKLSENSKHSILDKFYATVLLERAVSTESVLKLQKRLNKLSTQVAYFNKYALPKYVSLAKNECMTVDEALRSIERTKDFISNLGEEPGRYIQQLKEYFWSRFNLEQWSTETDYSSLFIPEEKNSAIVETLQMIVGILRKQEDEDEYVISKALKILSSDDSPLNKNVRDKLIHKLKTVFLTDELLQSYGDYQMYGRRGNKRKSQRSSYSYGKKTFDMNMDLFLLMNYSNVAEGLDERMIIPDIGALSEYISSCSYRRTGHFLSNEDVIVDLYRIIYDRIDRSPRRRSEYRMALDSLDNFVDQLSGSKKRAVVKEIKKITEVPDFTWISFVSTLLLCVSLFNLVGNIGLANWLAVIVRSLIVFVGVIVVGFDSIMDAREHGKFTCLLTQFVSGVSVFITLLITISTLI